jgi:IMP dehydrogenase / GMP reductase domain
VNHVRRTREAHPTKTLIAGNVVTGEMVEELILSGADIVKVLHLHISLITMIYLIHTYLERIRPSLYCAILHPTSTLFILFL